VEDEQVRRAKSASDASRIEADSRTQDFVNLFQKYGEMIVGHIAGSLDRPIDPSFLSKVNETVEPMLRRQVEELVKDYQRVTYEAVTGDAINPGEIAYRTRFPRRRRHHLRFITLSFADLVELGDEAPGKAMARGVVFPKVLLEGIDAWTRQILDLDQIDQINRAAFKALDRLDVITGDAVTMADRELWLHLHELDDGMDMIVPALLPFLQKFRQDFEGTLTHMQRSIGFGTGGKVVLNAKQWDLLFARIFGQLLRQIGANERPDQAAGIEEADRLLIVEVAEQYRKWRAANQLK
jgi:hypothetical protein